MVMMTMMMMTLMTMMMMTMLVLVTVVLVVTCSEEHDVSLPRGDTGAGIETLVCFDLLFILFGLRSSTHH